jgi:DNA integrity scanning protein DisA with diadenylate cyclase activity
MFSKRSELSGLDGATIMDEDGNLLAVGAIIRNDAGSSGGGRGSAAKKLSKYGGFSIKISTDGYIELFVNGANVYSIK